MVLNLVLLSALQAADGFGPIRHLPPVPPGIHIRMGPPKPTRDAGQDGAARSPHSPSGTQIRRMLRDFHLKRDNELESFDQYGWQYRGTFHVHGKIFLVIYEPRENLTTTWPDGKYHMLFGPDPDCCADDYPPPTRKQRARFRRWGIEP